MGTVTKLFAVIVLHIVMFVMNITAVNAEQLLHVLNAKKIQAVICVYRRENARCVK